jgi:PAS domain S-box-containing protein
MKKLFKPSALFFFGIFFALSIRLPAMAQSAEPPAREPLVLNDQQSEYPLGLHLDILEDPGGELTIADVSSPEFASKFTPSQTKVPNFGYTDSAYWVRLRLDNETKHTEHWLLEQGFANMQFLDLYSPRMLFSELPGNDGFSVKRSGILTPASTRDISHPRIVFDLTVPTRTEQTYYLRYQSGASMTLPLTLWTQAAFLDFSLKEHIAFGIYYGVLIGLLFYNLFLVFSLREASYLYFVLLLASLLAQESIYDGYFALYIAPNFPIINRYGVALSFALLFVSMILFSDTFLELKQRLPRLHQVNLILSAGWAALIVLTLIVKYHVVAILGVPWALLSILSILTAGIISWTKGFRPVRFFLIAWLGLLASLVWVLLIRIGWVPSTYFSENVYRLGFIWMAVCWSIALADRINVLKAETEQVNLKLRNSEHGLSQILDGLPIGVILYGKDQKPKYTNQRTVQIFSDPERGIKPDLAAGRTLAQAIPYFSIRESNNHQEYPLEKFPVFAALQGAPASAENIEIQRGDQQIALEIQASPVLDGAGNVESAVVAIQDISNRKQAEMALRTSEERFRAVVENIIEGIIFMDKDRNIMYMSPSYGRLKGNYPEEIIGQSGIGFVHPDDQAYTANKFRELLQQPGTTINGEYRIQHQDGSWVWIETNAINLLDNPHIRAVVLTSRDITNRKQAEVDLANNRNQLELLVKKRTDELNDANKQLQLRIEWLSEVNKIHQTITGTDSIAAAYQALSVRILQLLGANAVFIVRWADQDTHSDLYCSMAINGVAPESTIIQASFEKDTPLRQELDQGKTLLYSADQAFLLPEPIGACFHDHAFESFLLAPIMVRQPVIGVLGIVSPRPIKDFIPYKVNLIERMGYDLADLEQDAILLDQVLVLATLDERSRLARDLHDSVTQVLFSANLLAEVLPNIWRRDPELGLQKLDKLRQLTRGALAEMRTMLLELRPSAVINTPLSDLLVQLAEAIASRSGLQFQLFIERVPSLPENVQVNFYRIAQEALNNVVKHAQARQVMMSLSASTHPGEFNRKTGYTINLMILDDGVGFPTEGRRSDQLGIGIMHERAAAIQATFELESTPGHGTQMTLIWHSKSEGQR